jgi:hypothetical protein
MAVQWNMIDRLKKPISLACLSNLKVLWGGNIGGQKQREKREENLWVKA